MHKLENGGDGSSAAGALPLGRGNGCLQTLSIKDQAEWNQTLARAGTYDFYHTVEYHAMAQERDEGLACLFVYEEERYTVALPLLLRSIDFPAHHVMPKVAWKDATSVYGYAGPVASHTNIPRSVLQGFHTKLYGELRRRGVISVFSRLHPLIENGEILAGIGELKGLGKTVSICLRSPIASQKADYRENHKRGIVKLEQLGVVCIEDSSFTHLDRFVSLYTATMLRVGADDSYIFDHAYFSALKEKLGPACHLFIAWLNGEAIAGGVFIECGGILQYHLGASRDEYLKMAPMKMVFDTVRQWASQRGMKLFHLGGGVGSNEDSLFQFKAGFSKLRHHFACWRWVLDVPAYLCACEITTRCCEQNNLRPAVPEFFPAYRNRLVPRE
ncbi:MAG: GNAT family N-acetyltransferase [Verrucomicrobiota bacterium]